MVTVLCVLLVEPSQVGSVVNFVKGFVCWNYQCSLLLAWMNYSPLFVSWFHDVDIADRHKTLIWWMAPRCKVQKKTCDIGGAIRVARGWRIIPVNEELKNPWILKSFVEGANNPSNQNIPPSTHDPGAADWLKMMDKEYLGSSKNVKPRRW